MESSELEHLAKPLVYTSITLKGKDVTFVVWPDFNRGNNADEDMGAAIDAATFIRDELNEKQGSIGGCTNGIDTRRLGFERPIAIVTRDKNDRFQLSEPGEFEEEERILRETFTKYLKHKSSQ